MLISSEYLANFAFSNSCCSSGGFRPARAAAAAWNFNTLLQRLSGQPCHLAGRATIQMLRCGQRCPKNPIIGLNFDITWTSRLPAALCLLVRSTSSSWSHTSVRILYTGAQADAPFCAGLSSPITAAFWCWKHWWERSKPIGFDRQAA